MENSWFCTICLNKFFSFNTNIRMLKDKLVSRIFMTAFQKVKLKRVSNVWFKKFINLSFFSVESEGLPTVLAPEDNMAVL